MKKILLLILLFASPAFGQLHSYSTFTAKGFAKSATNTDTSTLVQPFEAAWVSIQTTTTGSDSSVIYVNVDAWINGLWSLSVARDTVTLGRPSGHVSSLAKGQVENYFLRTPSSDLSQNVYQFRIRNIHAAGSGDSTSSLTYTQNVITR